MKECSIPQAKHALYRPGIALADIISETKQHSREDKL